MPEDELARSVFINCPFDEEYAPLLEAAIFCVVYFGFLPRLANERLEGGENRLDKIVGMIRGSKYSIHDLSRSVSRDRDETFRMNMPFEFGVDFGLRHSGIAQFRTKKFLIFEEKPFELKRALSDTGGQDVEFHHCKYESVIEKVRNFFRVEVGIPAPGPSKLISDYATFQGWMMEKKIADGHSEAEVLRLPTRERLDEMKAWNELGRPSDFGQP